VCRRSGLFRDGVQFCSGLVDLVGCVRHHLGSGHRLTLAGERFVGLIAKDFTELGYGGAQIGAAEFRACVESNFSPETYWSAAFVGSQIPCARGDLTAANQRCH
jgi:hypothetical protein